VFQRFMENIVDVLFISHGKTGRALALLQDYVRTENCFSANCRKIFFSKDEEISLSLSLSLSLSSSVMTKIFETLCLGKSPYFIFRTGRSKYDNSDCMTVIVLYEKCFFNKKYHEKDLRFFRNASQVYDCDTNVL